MNFHHHQLKNGLEIITERMPYAQSVSFAFFIRCGSCNESPEIAGVSHFLEHMVFKGNQKWSAEKVNRTLDAIGANFNACTTEEYTVYYASVLPEYLEAAVEVFADILNPVCREEDFESEKRVILEEIQMYEESPPFGADERLREEFFGEHPLGHSILGTVASVSALTPQQMRNYLMERYLPGNITFVACGKVCDEEVIQMINKYCGAWENHGFFVPGFQPFTKPNLGERKINRPLATQHYILSNALAPPRVSELRYAARVFHSVVGDDSGSRLYWELVDNGWAEHAVLSYTEYAQAGVFTTSMCCEPEDGDRNMEVIHQLYQKLQKKVITEDELQLAKNRIATALVLSSEKSWGRLFMVGSEWVNTHQYYTVSEEMQLLKTVSLADIHAVIEQYPLTKSLTYRIGAD
ncbi:MAG: pitrilysin family protein [Planctomycetia bacterium]|nr:pitrilysin family protein [Planctomycetia bacterium]